MHEAISAEEVQPLLTRPESDELEFKGSVPPRSVMAQQISAFANTKGGWLIIGVGERKGKFSVTGVSPDSLAPVITEAALASVQPRPVVRHGLVGVDGLLIYAINIEKSQTPVAADHDVLFERKATRTVPVGVSTPPHGVKGAPPRLADLFCKIRGRGPGTASLSRLARQYDSLAVIAAENSDSVCVRGSARSSTFHHGRSLLRLLFSSVVDSWERYLSDLLLEICLANPNTLKSESSLTAKEVLDCTTILELVKLIADRKLEKLTRGSLETFDKHMKPILGGNLFDAASTLQAKRLFQIRNLYTHSNGIIDERFVRNHPSESFRIGDEHRESLDNWCLATEFFFGAAARIDSTAISKHDLSLDSSPY